MDRHQLSKKAPQRGAFFVFPLPLFLCAIGLFSPVAQGGECPADRTDEAVEIAFVYDGDTVRLKDGRKIRLAGINAPEVSRKDKPGEPLADEARAHLSRLLDSGRRVHARYEQERRDRYGRLLAHLYLADGSSIEERLLEEGLAQQLVVPPNRWQSSCYERIEQRARQQRRGLWRLDYYQPLRVSPARTGDGSFRIIGGSVVRVAESRKSVWLNLDTGMAIRIARRDLHYFTDIDLHGLKGHSVVARGWLKYDGQRFQTTVRHPSALMKASDWN
jgi:endonuclease YncB( thermonuclease family)